MVRIPTPQRSVEYSGRGGAAPVENVQQTAGMASRELQQLGGALQGLGNEYATLASRIERTAIENEKSQAVSGFSLHMSDSLPAIMTKPPLERAEEYERIANEFYKGQTYRYEKTQNDMRNTIDRQIASNKWSFTKQGLNEEASDFHNNLSNDMSVFIKDNDIEGWEAKLQFGDENGHLYSKEEATKIEAAGGSVPEDRKVEYWEHRFNVAAVEYTAMNQLRTDMTNAEAVINAVKSNPDLDMGDKTSTIAKLRSAVHTMLGPQSDKNSNYKKVKELSMQQLRDNGMEVATDYVRQALDSDLINVDEAATLTSRMEQIENQNFIKIGIKAEANNEAAVNDMSKRIGNIETWPTPDEVENNFELAPTERKAWYEISNNAGSSGKVDMKKLVDYNETLLFRKWRGNKEGVKYGDDGKLIGSKRHINTDVALARYGNEPIMDDGTYKNFTEMLETNVEPQYIAPLQTAFVSMRETIQKDSAFWGMLNRNSLSLGEAEAIYEAQTGLFHWLIANVNAKKRPSSQDIQEMSNVLLTDANRRAKAKEFNAMAQINFIYDTLDEQDRDAYERAVTSGVPFYDIHKKLTAKPRK